GATAVGDGSFSSSRIMSLQTSMHSSQMQAVGPAISFRTSAWALLQNEQRGAGSSGVLIRVLIISLLSPVLLCGQCEAQICGVLGESRRRQSATPLLSQRRISSKCSEFFALSSVRQR